MIAAALLAMAILGGTPPKAVFSDIVYADAGSKPGAPAPVLPGFYPDPSIVRVKADYYLINSSFAFYPGIPVWHSKDLKHWTQIGNAIDRPGMLDFSGRATSHGVFAPDISYHDGLFWIVNTCIGCKGNFVITAKDPKGPWSDPAWLPAVDGIDPALFWDDDGRAYIVHNGPPPGTPQYQGHTAIWLESFDPKTRTTSGAPKLLVNGGTDISQKPIWIEGPHLFKKDGVYYLMAAQGGTEVNHSEVIFRADHVEGPYVPYAGNPILTQRDVPQSAVSSTGHADLVSAVDGQWVAVFLGTRPYAPPAGQGQQGLFNTGRETFLLPISWKDGWPTILPQGQAVPATATAAPVTTGYDPLSWLQIRTPKTPFLTRGKGTVILTPRPEAIGDVASHPAFTGHRQQEASASIGAILAWQPRHDGDRSGLAAVQSDDYYTFFGLARHDGHTVVEVTRRSGPNDPRDGVVVTSQPWTSRRPVHLRLTVTDGEMRATADGKVIADHIDATNLSTQKAGGFVGTILGLYAYGQD